MGAQGRVIAVCSSAAKGEKKEPIPVALLEPDRGIAGDAHAGSERQVSLLAVESIEEMRRLGLELSPGAFAENLTTAGLIIHALPIGTRLEVGETVILEITQIGKQCHDRCRIFEQVGRCVMPTQGVFARVVRGGEVRAGDTITVISDD